MARRKGKNKKKKKINSPQRHRAVKYRTTCKNSLFLRKTADIFFAYWSVSYLIVFFKRDEIGNK
jgi:hypothetical protein